MNTVEIGKVLKELRKSKGLSQQELAIKIPVTRQAVSNWETGKSIPDCSVLKILSTIFDVSIDDIISK